jgi:hypothetical protein
MVWAVLNPAQNAALTELMEGQNSDRIVAILGGAMLDDSLRNALELRLRPAKSTNDKLFGIGGPLGNTGPKIDLAYQLYMFEKPMLDAMHGLTEIRNLFAHRLDMTFFDAGKKFTGAVAKLTLHEGRTHYPNPFRNRLESDHELEPTDSVRGKFFVNLQICLIWLMGDRHEHLPWSNAQLLPAKQLPGA